MVASNLGVSSEPGIHIGFWTNWSHGRVLGATLTLDQEDGALLIAFVALFVAFVGARLWKIVCYALHHYFSDSANRDAIYHQRQAVLRNSDTAEAGLLRWYRILIAWRKRTDRLYSRILPLALFCVVMLGTFTAGGILSSRIASSSGNQVLINSGYCGVNILGAALPGSDRNPSVVQDRKFFTVLIPFLAQRLVYFADYAQQCYTQNPAIEACKVYVKPQLPSIVDRAAECPFQDEICKLKHGNIRIDTGYLNSHDDFGLNTPPDERFLYRRITHCAPLVSRGYTAETNFTGNGTQTTYAQVLYGPYYGATDTNVTYISPKVPMSEYAFASAASTSLADYSLNYQYVNTINGSLGAEDGFMPIPALHRDDADITMVFLSANQILYPLPVDDPWYSAHTKIPGAKLTFSGWNDLQLYGRFADQTISTLGCTKQYQICYPDASGNPETCSRLGGKQELYYLLESLPQSSKLKNLTSWGIQSALTGNEMDAFIETQRGASLRSRFALVSGFSGPLPDNQWQLDVEGWHASTLAAMQASAVDAATGPASPAMRRFWSPPDNEQARYLCQNQKVSSSAHTNFNVFGLAFTLIVGGITIIISIVLEPAVAYYQRRYSKFSYAQLEWVSNGTLQLQSLAQEEQGAGIWTNATKYVPVCRTDDLLSGLDASNPTHPRLRPPMSSIVDKMSPISPVSPDEHIEKPELKPVDTGVSSSSTVLNRV